MRKLRMDELERLSVEEFKQSTKTPVALVLDNVRSGLNVGSAFRTADAFALEHIYLCGITAIPPHREILKTALGSTETVAWSHHADLPALVAQLKNEGYQVLAVEQVDQSIPLSDFQVEPDTRYALIFGNEVEGVSSAVLPQCHACLEIPQAGTKHSINVAVCVGIVCWELFRQFKWA